MDSATWYGGNRKGYIYGQVRPTFATEAETNIASNKASNLYSSGSEMVYAQTILAVVGALALQRGGEVANKIVRERVLDPLGL